MEFTFAKIISGIFPLFWYPVISAEDFIPRCQYYLSHVLKNNQLKSLNIFSILIFLSHVKLQNFVPSIFSNNFFKTWEVVIFFFPSRTIFLSCNSKMMFE